jgi:hypothetical protein
MHTTLIEFTYAIERVRKALVQVCQRLVASMQSLVHMARKLTEWLRVSQDIPYMLLMDSILDCSRWVLMPGADMVTLSTHTYKHTQRTDTSWTQAEIGVHGNVNHKLNRLQLYRCGCDSARSDILPSVVGA